MIAMSVGGGFWTCTFTAECYVDYDRIRFGGDSLP